MIEKAYDLLLTTLIYVSGIWGFIFLLLSITKNKLLKNYNIMRKALSFAYIVLAAMGLLELMTKDKLEQNFPIVFMVTLIAASFNSFLFTYSLITLIKIHFIKRKWVFIELGIIILFSIICIFSYFSKNEIIYKLSLGSFLVYYISQLIRYTCTFLKYYKMYKREIENYYSELNSIRQTWVIYAFFMALIVGCVALLVFVLPMNAIVFIQLFFIVFYFLFGVYFINYTNYFNEIISAINYESENNAISAMSQGSGRSLSYSELEAAVDKWVQEKKYTQEKITIEQIAVQINTNKTYLSLFINTEKGKPFNTWINELRVEEAKKIILESPSLPIGTVGEMIGIPEQSNFTKVFFKIESRTPFSWRKEMTKL